MLHLGGREMTWVRREVAKTVVPVKKDARVVPRDMTVRSREVKNIAGVMWKEEKRNGGDEKNRAKICFGSIDSCPFKFEFPAACSAG